ncbi:kinase-like protein [Coniochaeta ligniaria NRRL 30616]|uniref:EKC/KEOPS complex subunit BUD32 n=1 Tax=Coniochaeta ligniaria NRRL 30616 TaxID=1408157 RepID=A0A1J7IZ21_9PEZI|nr:kinase-like protein [Coniochaeta ligniaria NRRL 30616]
MSASEITDSAENSPSSPDQPQQATPNTEQSTHEGDSAEKAPFSPEELALGTPLTEHFAIEEGLSYGYFPEMWDHEDLDQYRPGGLHPIIIGDTLGSEGRFKVVRKLGAGGVATVWLCRDQEKEKWVAVKVLGSDASLDAAQCQVGEMFGEMAALKHFWDLEVEDAELAANHVCLPDEYFILEGPNGTHFALVLPILGGDISRAWFDYGYKPEVLREICAQMVIAMNYIHSKGICHGDFRPANILYTLDGIENASEDEINAMFPECEEVEVGPIPATGEEPGPHLPKFIYSSTSLRRQTEHEKDNVNIVVCDFGESYLVDKSPGCLGIPVKYAAPEVLLNPGLGFGCATDIWALATSIFEVRHRGLLVNHISESMATSCLEEMLGPLPEPFRSAWFSKGLHSSWNTGDTRDPSEIPLSEFVAWPGEHRGYSLESLVRKSTRLLSRLTPGEDLSKRPGQEDAGDGYCKWLEYQIPEDEADQLIDLLSGIIKYSPAERLSLKEVMAHPWFSGRFASSEIEDVDMDRVVEHIVQAVVDEVVDGDPVAKDVIDCGTAQKEVENDGSGDDDVQMTENGHIHAPVKTSDGESKDETMTDVQSGLPPLETKSEEDHEVFYDAVETPADVVPVGRIARTFARLRVLFFPATWRLRGACFGA